MRKRPTTKRKATPQTKTRDEFADNDSKRVEAGQATTFIACFASETNEESPGSTEHDAG